MEYWVFFCVQLPCMFHWVMLIGLIVYLSSTGYQHNKSMQYCFVYSPILGWVFVQFYSPVLCCTILYLLWDIYRNSYWSFTSDGWQVMCLKPILLYSSSKFKFEYQILACWSRILFTLTSKFKNSLHEIITSITLKRLMALSTQAAICIPPLRYRGLVLGLAIIVTLEDVLCLHQLMLQALYVATSTIWHSRKPLN